ncbi:Brp/Blh family beta-carotene 15,15'-dioxygenase [Mucisphaera sp.]|uniref:Brp/Blh family beta-carotene 15,15'-dioxygenase n=1 Tax=Mucisphaera sp. TaxID=2913024 RepID=UPI003D0F19BB
MTSPRTTQLILLMAIPAAWLSPTLAQATAYWLLILSLPLLGMPHGAMDWPLLKQLKRRGAIRSLSQVTAFYTFAMACCLAGVLAAPWLAAVLFLVLTAWHFGFEDAHHRGTQSARPAIGMHSYALARGLVLVASVCVANPGQATRPFAIIAGSQAPLSESIISLIALVILIPAALSLTIMSFRQTVSRSARNHEITEHALVLILGLTAPPLFTIAVYFFAIHSLRHTKRLSEELGISFWQLHLASLPWLIPALLAIPACHLLLHTTTINLETVATAIILSFMIATPPHHALDLMTTHNLFTTKPAEAPSPTTPSSGKLTTLKA